MKRAISWMLTLVIILALFACERRNAAQQNAALEQTQAAATLNAMVAQGGGQQPPGGGQQPSQGGGQQPPGGGQQPSQGGGQQPSGGGQQPSQGSGQQPSGGGQQPSQGSGQQPPGGGQAPEPPHPSGDQADLAVTKIELSDTSPEPNQTLQVKVTIENRGPGAARNFQWGVIPTYSAIGPNNPVGGENITVLNAGVAKIYQVEAVYPSAGLFILRAVADLNNAVNDPDRNNNARDTNVGVTGALPLNNQKPTADLKVTNVTASNLTPNVNEEVKISATVFNGGPDPVKNLTWAIYPNYMANALINTPNTGVIAQLNPNDDTFISIRTSYSVAGTYTVRVIADYQNAVDDPRPGGAEIKIKVGGGGIVLEPGGTNADVMIGDYGTNPLSTGIGQPVVIWANIENQGPDTVTNLDWSIDPTYVSGAVNTAAKTGVIASLAPNARKQVTHNFTYPLIGTMKIHIVVDPQHKITDPNGNNNVKDTQIQVAGQALPPEPRNCEAWAVSPTVVNLSFTAPAGDPSQYEGFRIYEHALGLRTTILGVGIANLAALQPNTNYQFYVVSFKGNAESNKNACIASVKTPAQ